MKIMKSLLLFLGAASLHYGALGNVNFSSSMPRYEHCANFSAAREKQPAESISRNKDFKG